MGSNSKTFIQFHHDCTKQDIQQKAQKHDHHKIDINSQKT